MRDPSRLIPAYKELAEVHKNTFPDWRIGQMFDNFASWLKLQGLDIYYLEDDKYIKMFKKFLKEDEND